jgi:hypothetical protein
MGMSAKPLIQVSMTRFPKQEVNLHHGANVGVQETSLVCCSAESERRTEQSEGANKWLLLTIPYIDCHVTQPYRKVVK